MGYEGPEEYQIAVDAAPVPMSITRRADGLILHANALFGQLFGVPPRQMIGRKTSEFYYDAKDREILLGLLDMNGVVRNHELHVKKADGSDFWVIVSEYPVEIDRAQALICGFYDVSDRRKAEEALRVSEERFRSAFENARIGMALVALDGHLLQVNRTCCEELGYSEPELLSMTWRDVTHPEDVDITEEPFRRALSGAVNFFEAEKRFIHKLGHVLWGHMSSSAVRDPDGNLLYFITQIQDITERKRATDELRMSKERYRQLVEDINDMIYELDAGGTFAYVSPVSEQMAGYAPSELIGRRFSEFIHPDDRPNMVRRFQHNRLTSQTGIYEFRITTKTDGTVWVRSNGRPIEEDGRVTGYRGALVDITERKQAEEVLQATRQALEDRVEEHIGRGSAFGLTFREMTVLHLIIDGKSDKEIGTLLGISAGTASKHVGNILLKLNVDSRTEGCGTGREGWGAGLNGEWLTGQYVRN